MNTNSKIKKASQHKLLRVLTPTEHEALVFAFEPSKPSIRQRLERVRKASLFSPEELAACRAEDGVFRFFYKVALFEFTDGTFISAGFLKWLGRRIVAIGIIPLF